MQFRDVADFAFRDDTRTNDGASYDTTPAHPSNFFPGDAARECLLNAGLVGRHCGNTCCRIVRGRGEGVAGGVSHDVPLLILVSSPVGRCDTKETQKCRPNPDSVTKNEGREN
jgi:hypothetical protein